MKNLFLKLLSVLLLSIAVVSNNSCSKVDDLIDDITVPVPIPVSSSVNTKLPLAIANTEDFVEYPEVPLNIDVEAEIKKKFTSASINNLKSVKLDSFSIQYLSSVNGINMKAVKNAKLYIKTPALNKVLIAEAVNNTSDKLLNFTPINNVELLDYFKTNQNSLILEIQGAEVATDLLDVRIDSSFKIQVSL